MDARRLGRGTLLVAVTALVAGTTTSAAVAAGNGTFTAAPDSPFGAGSTPSALGVIEFNGDGDPDIVAVNRDSPDLTFLVGAGDAGFGSSPVTAPPPGAQRGDIAVGDLTGDGVVDFAVSNPTVDAPGTSGLTIFLVSGGVITPTTVNVTQRPSKLALADFDGDTDRDIAVTTSQNERFAVLTNDGAGAFAPANTKPTGEGASAIATADFNGDGDPDLALTSTITNSVSVHTGEAGATFADKIEPGPSTGSLPSDIAVADFNADGDPDLAVTNGGSDDVTILTGLAGAAFAAAGTISVGDSPSSLIATDLNGDGDPDLAVTNQAPGAPNGSVSVLLGGTGATFVAAPGSPITSAPEPLAITSGDFNADGDIDLATADGANDTVSVLLGNATSSPPPPGGGDTTAPQTTIDKGPKAKTHKRKAKIRYSADEPSTFECRLKGKGVDQGDGGFFPCGKAKIKFKHLAPGKKKFQVRATDAAGNTDQTPAKLKWKIVR